MVTQADVYGWADGLDGVVDRIAPRFGRVEPRRRARAYRRGLLGPGGGQKGGHLAGGGRGAAAGAGLSTGLAGAGGAQERLATGRSGGRCDPRWGAGLPEPGAVGG